MRGSGAVVTRKNRNVRLRGASLTAFLKQLERRIEVTRCLSGSDEPDGTDDQAGLIAEFSTAAGTESSQVVSCERIPQVDW